MDIERLAAENARLKAALSKHGFTITYTKTGTINRITKPRKPRVQHTAVTWARKLNISADRSLERKTGKRAGTAYVRRVTKDRKMTLRKYKNLLERGELIREAQDYLKQDGFKIPSKYFDKVPTYVLKNNAFYENINNMFNYDEVNDSGELDNDTIKKAMDTSIKRIRKANGKVKAAAAKASKLRL